MLLPREWIQSPLGSARGSAHSTQRALVQPHTCMHFLGRLTITLNGRIQREEEGVSVMMQKSVEVLPSLQTSMWSSWREKWSPAEIQPRGPGDGCSSPVHISMFPPARCFCCSTSDSCHQLPAFAEQPQSIPPKCSTSSVRLCSNCN